MIRPILLRALPRTLPSPVSTLAARRWATTHAPTTSGEVVSASTSVSTGLAPGEEIDPQLNGYPQLPYVSLQQREPFGWWDQQERKNFGEVVHEEEDAIGMWGPDAHKISGGTALLSMIAAFSAVGGFAYFLVKTRPSSQAVRREYPYGGLEKELGGHGHARAEEESFDE